MPPAGAGRLWRLRGAAVAAGVTAISGLGILFNTGAGQHILKNPLVVNSIIEKVPWGGGEERGGPGVPPGRWRGSPGPRPRHRPRQAEPRS